MATSKFSSNHLRTVTFDNSSNWVVSFSGGKGTSERLSGLNLIIGQFVPAIDVEYDQLIMNKESLELGPGVSYDYLTHIKPTRAITLTVFDNIDRSIRNTIIKWANEIITTDGSGMRAPNMASISSHALTLNIHRVKQGEIVDQQSYNVVPDGSISFRGDQDYGAVSIPLTFLVISNNQPNNKKTN